MSKISVMLDEEQTKELRQEFYQMMYETAIQAKRDVGMDKDLLNQKEMCDWLGVATNTLTSFVKQGLPVHIMGSRKFYSKQEVRQFMLAQ